MHRLALKIRTLAIATALLGLTHSEVNATAFNWTAGTNNNVLNSVNWLPVGVPSTNDTAEFSDVTLSYSPILFGGVFTLDPYQINFVGLPASYTFSIQGINAYPGPTMVLGNLVTPGGGVDNSTIINPLLQQFVVTDGGVVEFINSASADINSSQLVTYQLSSSDAVFPSRILFEDSSTASTATISVGSGVIPNTLISFFENSTAANSAITLNSGSLLTFSNSATAAASTINVNTGSTTIFNDSSSVGSTAITANASSIIFSTTTPASTGQVNLTNFSSATLQQNITLQKLVTDGTGTVYLNNNILTLDTVAAGEAINGIISGFGGKLVKQGLGELSLNAANVYGGGTTVAGGNLIVTTTSLPSSAPFAAVITNTGTLTFSQANTATYAGNINISSSTGTLAVTICPNLTFSGILSGNGKLALNGGNVKLTNTSNSYGGGTSILNGTLTTSTTTLPMAFTQPSVIIGAGGVLSFNQAIAGTYAGAINLATADALLLTSGSGPYTLSGALTGSGKLTLNSTNVTLTNSANTYTGGTDISIGSTLQGAAPAIQSNILNNGQLIFDQLNDSTYSGVISSTVDALITKVGLGNLTFIGASPDFKGTTNVQAGGFYLNNILGGSMNAYAGTRLSGTGTLLGSLSNSGTIAPGNSIGTFHVGGNYIQGPSGTYEAEIDGAGQSDLIDVGGSAALSGALVIISVDGVINPSHTYTLLHAGGGVQGFFTQVISTNPMLVPLVVYTANDVQLKVQHLFTAVAENHNQSVVAFQLQQITNPSAEEQAILDTFTQLASNPNTVDSARLALSQMSGEQYTNTLLTSAIANRQFLRRLYDPLRVIITDRPQPCDDYCDPCGSDGFIPISAWMEVGGGRSFLSHNHNAGGFKADSIEVSFGAQTTLGGYWTLGVAGGYQHDNLNYNIGGSGKNAIGLLGFYALYRPEGYYLMGDFVVDLNHSKIKRPITIGELHYTAKGSPKSVQETLYFEAGKDFGCGGLLLQPFLGLEVDFYTSNKLSENGASPLNLAVGKKSHTNAFSRLGLHLSTSQCCGLFWTFNVDLAWQYRLTEFSNTINQRFQDFGDDFTIYGVSVPRNSLDAAANITARLCDGWELFAEASAERWSHASTFTILGGVKYSW